MPGPDNEKRQTFATAYVQSGNATQAAIAAGVPAGSAATMGSRWLRNPAITALIREAMDVQLKHLAPVALSVIREMIEDPGTPPAIRLSACKDVLDRSNYVPPKRVEAKVEIERAPIELLTREELEALVAREAAALSIVGECREVETDEDALDYTNSGHDVVPALIE
jgi:hypothetical protein